MPALSSTMTSGKIVKWNKQIGDYINIGDIIMTVESDKADMDVESFEEGYLRKKTLDDGSEASVGDIIGIITSEKTEEIKINNNIAEKNLKDKDKTSNKEINENENFIDSNKKELNKKNNIINELKKEVNEINENNILIHYKDVLNKSENGRKFLNGLKEEEHKILEERLKLNFNKYGNVFSNFLGNENTNVFMNEKEEQNDLPVKIILPSASELMKQKQINPNDITETKIPNRITYEDVDNYLKNKNKKNIPENTLKEINSSNPKELSKNVVEMTNIQKAIKNNMVQTLNVPTFRITHLIKTNELIKLYKQVKDKINMTVILNKCVSKVLLKHPIIYSTYIDDGNGKIIYNDNIHIGNALGLNDSLLTPVLKNVNTENIYTLAEKWKELVNKGKNGLLSANEMSGSNFYISNLGMFNTYQFDAILPKNASCILSVGSNFDTIENEEELKIQKGMMMTLTCDHRHIYGYHAANFMSDLSNFIENNIMNIFL